MCMGIPTNMRKWEWIWEEYTSDNGNGNGYFFMCAKIPIGRLDTNVAWIAYHFLTAICDISLYAEDNMTLTVRDS